MKKIKILTLMVLSVLGITYGNSQIINLNHANNISCSSGKIQQNIPEEYTKEAKSARPFTINQQLQSRQNVSIGSIIDLQLFADKNYQAKVSNITTDVNGTLAITAKLTDYPMGYAIITTASNGKSLVSVSVPELNEKYVSRGSIDSGQNYLIEIDDTKTPKFKENDGILPKSDTAKQFGENVSAKKKTSKANSNCGIPDNLGETDLANIDIMMVYTPAALAWSNSSENGINNTIANTMAKTQLTMSSSQVFATITLVHSQWIDYTEAGINNDLYRLTDKSDGYMDNVHDLRKQYNADIVVLVESTNDAGGLGWVLNTVNGNPSIGFNCVRVQQISTTITSIHEIGHNVGMQHNIENANPYPLFPYAYGWHWSTQNGISPVNITYGSVMSYIGNETPYFSNPDIIDHGKPTGDIANANNAKVFRQTKHAVASYSDRLNDFISAPTALAVPTVTCNGATLTWKAVEGAEYYEIYIDTPQGILYADTDTNSITFDEPGYFSTDVEYTWTVIAINACGTESEESVESVFKPSCQMATRETSTKAAMKIYPIPAKNILNISVEKSSDFKIFSTTGTLVKAGKLNAGNNELNINSLTKGVYILKTNGETHKIIVE